MNTTRNNCKNCGKPLSLEHKRNGWPLCFDCYNKVEISQTIDGVKKIIKPSFK